MPDEVWQKVKEVHPEFKREFFPGLDDDPYMISALVVNNECRYSPQPGHHVMDVGANRGIFTVLCALNGAYVTAYEPEPRAFQKLQAAVERADVLRLVTLHNKAIWTLNGRIPFESGYQPPHDGATWDETNGLIKPDAVDRVECVSFEDALSEGERDCVKMDIEGAEYRVLDETPGKALVKAKVLTVEMHPGRASELETERIRLKLSSYFRLDVGPGLLCTRF